MLVSYLVRCNVTAGWVLCSVLTNSRVEVPYGRVPFIFYHVDRYHYRFGHIYHLRLLLAAKKPFLKILGLDSSPILPLTCKL